MNIGRALLNEDIDAMRRIFRWQPLVPVGASETPVRDHIYAALQKNGAMLRRDIYSALPNIKHQSISRSLQYMLRKGVVVVHEIEAAQHFSVAQVAK